MYSSLASDAADACYDCHQIKYTYIIHTISYKIVFNTSEKLMIGKVLLIASNLTYLASVWTTRAPKIFFISFAGLRYLKISGYLNNQAIRPNIFIR